MARPIIGITGFGRFGQVLHRLFADSYDILVSSSTYKTGDIPGVTFAPLEQVVRRSQAVLLAVPINKMGEMAERIRPFVHEGQVIVDVCSIKEHSRDTLKRVLGGCKVHIWPTHPMFGPDSSQGGFAGLRWVSCEEGIDPKVIAHFIAHLEAKGLKIVRISCSEHDRLAARTQGLTHLIGRVLEDFGAERTLIDTAGFEQLMQVKDQTCNDSWELFCDLHYYNPYTIENERMLRESILKVFARLLDSTIRRDKILIGIQGDQGSFNDEAVHFLLGRSDLDRKGLFGGKQVEIVYLITSQAVLSAITTGKCDYGLFAIESSGSGVVIPSMEAMSRHNFHIVDIFNIPLVQCLLCHPDAAIDELDQVFSHPQALSQCERTLARDFPRLRKVIGSDQDDTALTAAALAEGKLGKNVAVIASETAAVRNGLKIIRKGIHDDPENRTSFAFVKRRQLNDF